MQLINVIRRLFGNSKRKEPIMKLEKKSDRYGEFLEEMKNKTSGSACDSL
jgi:hypothetical protein